MTAQAKTRPKMTLYQCPFYRSLKPLWLIYELGIHDDIDLVRVDTFSKETEDYKEYERDVHPHGTVPALVVEGEGVMLESTAICLFLADLYGKLAPPLDKRREYYDWIMYGSVTMEEALEFFYWQWAVPEAKPDPEGLQKMRTRYDICMKRLTNTLEGRDYICGDSLTAADCIVGFTVWRLAQDYYNGGCLVKDFPVVQAYIKRLTDRPALQAAVQAQGEMGPHL